MNKITNSLIYLILTLFMLGACTPSEEELRGYVGNFENGLIVTEKTERAVTFNLQYIPTEILIFNELKTGILKKEDVDQRKEELDFQEHYILRVEGIEQEANYQNPVYVLVNGGKEVAPAFEHRENLGQANSFNVLLDFNVNIINSNEDRLLKIVGTNKEVTLIRIKAAAINKYFQKF